MKTPREIRRRAENAANPFFANRPRNGSGPSVGTSSRSTSVGGSGFGTRTLNTASARKF